MKAKTIFFVIIMLAVIVPEGAIADWKIYYTGKAAEMFGSAGRGSFATKAQCEASRATSPRFEQSNCHCDGFDTPSGYSGGNPAGGGRRPYSTPPSGGSGDSGGNTTFVDDQKRAAEKEKVAFDSGHNELMMGLKRGTATEVPGLKTGTTALPVIGSGNSQSIGLKPYDTAAKEKTIKALKELNGSVYWGLKAASAALDAKDEVTKTLDDKWADARKYAENSGMAMSGTFVPGSPEFEVRVPDVPPPVEANPQIQLYNYIVQQTKILVPDIIETQKAIEKTKQSSGNIKKDIADNRNETEQLVEKLLTTKNEEEKDKLKATYEEKNKEYDELTAQAKQADKEAGELDKKADKQRENYADLQKSNDAVQANPERAQEILKNLQESEVKNE
jgi:hypothetical protein